MLAQEIAAKYRITPLDCLLSIINDKHASFDDRLEAAKAAAPYVHRKMPAMVDVKMETKSVVVSVVKEDLRRLDERELDTVITAFEKMKTVSMDVQDIDPTNFLEHVAR